MLQLKDQNPYYAKVLADFELRLPRILYKYGAKPRIDQLKVLEAEEKMFWLNVRTQRGETHGAPRRKTVKV